MPSSHNTTARFPSSRPLNYSPTMYRRDIDYSHKARWSIGNEEKNHKVPCIFEEDHKNFTIQYIFNQENKIARKEIYPN